MPDEINNVATKFVPFKCPNCNGFGTLQYGKKTCHTCKGRGAILINQETGEIHEPKIHTANTNR
jgi:DnaJ-class molecular chaperone